MLKFLMSKEFLFTTLFLVIVFIFHDIDKLSSYIQDFGLYGWAFVIWKMDKHNTLLTALTKEEE